MALANLEKTVDKAKTLAEKRIYGEKTLTVGELVGFLIALFIIFSPKANPVPAKYRVPLGLLIIFVSSVLF